MKNKNEYQGGVYAIFAFVGLYVRFFMLKIIGVNRTIKYLSGEEQYPKINTKQRFFCLIVGLISILIMIFLVFLLISNFTNC